MKSTDLLNELKTEIELIRKRHTTFKDDSAFVFWFLLAYLTDKEELAKNALTGKEGGRTGEKNIDGIFIDERAQQCNIIQGKFHMREGVSEKRNDVLSFCDLGLMPWDSKEKRESFFKRIDPLAANKLNDVLRLVKAKKYTLNLYYVTTGSCSDSIIDEAEQRLREAEGNVDIFIISRKKVLNIFNDYLEGIAPAVPLLKLRISSEGSIQHAGLIQRFDPETKIESWVFSANGNSVGELFAKAGIRLFAKNIRGYLGSTDINESMSETIIKEPHNFWYYNNGITIVCNDAKRESKEGQDILKIEGAQVINGQQTTRTLQHNESSKTNALVKIIKIPRSPDDDSNYDRLVNTIVRATNWQNAISPSDLVSNDYIQVYLERELRKRGYQYIRKKMSKSEARSLFGQGYYQIDKRELAQAVACCLLDPAVVRRGKEGLFEDPYYKSIFSTKNISFYLSKYWLMKQVHLVSRGYPERAYAKWVVINFAWGQLGTHINNGTSELKFRKICECKEQRILTIFHQYLTILYRSALQFYRVNRGKGDQAKDISTFFQLKKLHTQFQVFWNTANNNQARKRADQKLKQCIDKIKKYEIED
jgi:hypothetical protein